MELETLIVMVFLAIAANAVSAHICGICGTQSHAVCYNATHFALCDEALKPTWDEGVCPPGMFCTNDERICVSEESTQPCMPPCGSCTNERYACRNNSTFSLCFGQETPNEMEFNCPYGKICSTIKHIETQSDDYCFDPATLQSFHIDCSQNFSPVLRNSPSTITSTAFCRLQNKPGFFVNIKDSSQKSYYRCRYVGGKLIGSMEKCPLSRIFDKNQGTCV